MRANIIKLIYLNLLNFGSQFRGAYHTVDGFLGLDSVFSGIPFQICHFHVSARCRQLLSNNPQSIAGRELLYISKHLGDYTREKLEEELSVLREKHGFFLNEKTIHPDGTSSFTHRSVRGALRTLTRFSQWMFTYIDVLHMPRTSNSLEGHFSHIKDILRVHRGLSVPMKRKVLDEILLASTIAK